MQFRPLLFLKPGSSTSKLLVYFKHMGMFAPQSSLVLLAFASKFCLVAWALPQVEQSDYIDQLKFRLIDQNLTTLEAGQ